MIWGMAEELVEISIDYTQCFREARFHIAKIPERYVKVTNTKKSPLYHPESFGWYYEKWVDWSNGSATTSPIKGFVYQNGTYVPSPAPVCHIVFPVATDMQPPLRVYYKLTNYYQNHRDYVSSFSLKQLKGQSIPSSAISGSDCRPLDIDPVTKKVIYPCGLIANSIFNG
jgi:hypothetical protein